MLMKIRVTPIPASIALPEDLPKLDQIKRVREAFGTSLPISKDFVEGKVLDLDSVDLGWSSIEWGVLLTLSRFLGPLVVTSSIVIADDEDYLVMWTMKHDEIVPLHTRTLRALGITIDNELDALVNEKAFSVDSSGVKVVSLVDHSTLATMNISQESIEALFSGDVAPESVENLHHAAKSLLDITSLVDDGTGVAYAPDVPVDDPFASLDLHISAAIVKTPSQTPDSEDPPSLKLYPVFNKKAVDLYKATELYQPVRGTGGSSVYFLVGWVGPYKLAARYQGSKVSVRMEQEEAKSDAEFKAMASHLGLALAGEYHASAHVHVDNVFMAGKTIGAMVGGMAAKGLICKLPLPSASEIHDKGA